MKFIIPLLLFSLTSALSASRADACGGFFCSDSPVEQTGERILFEWGEDGRITTTVDITFSGNSGDFSWIVPVPETPDLVDVAPPSSLRIIDQLTRPQIVIPNLGCIGGEGEGEGEGDGEGEGEGEVVVETLPVVGPFAPEVLSADNAQTLVDWLRDNGYLVTPEMEPYIEQYLGDGFKFLGVKLAPGAGVSEISPLTFSCPQGAPMIPLQLTAVASEPEMVVKTFVLGERLVSPMNYRDIQIQPSDLHFDPWTYTTDYFSVASYLIDQEGGKAFVTEFAGQSSELESALVNQFINTIDGEEAKAWVLERLRRNPALTRLFTRISDWEMDEDPVFAYSPRENFSRRIALELDEDEICNFDTPTNPCFDTYCGVGSTCALSENGEAGCVCNVGTSARAISGATGQRALGSGFATLFCVESDVNLLQSLEGVDPCAQNSCGAGGECLPINGAATCRCDDDHVALRRFDGIQCVPRSIDEAPEQLYPQVRIPPSQSAPRSALCECSSLVPNTPWFSIAGLALCGLFAQRRRRRRR